MSASDDLPPAGSAGSPAVVPGAPAGPGPGPAASACPGGDDGRIGAAGFGAAGIGAAGIADRGTPEAVWRAWDQPRQWPVLDRAGVQAAVVVAPHPDDEVLGVGGLMTLLRRAGVSVSVLAVTDGDGSHPGSPTVTPARLARLRAAQRRAALAELGLADVPLRRLGIRDTAVGDEVESLADEIARQLVPGAWCLATFGGDGDQDHEAVGRAAAIATERAGAVLVEYPVRTWHWATPADPRVPWSRARRVPLPAGLAASKRRAAGRFVTQLAPLSPAPADAAVLPPHVLERLLRDTETVFWPDRPDRPRLTLVD